MDLRYIHKQKAQLALSFLPIGTPRSKKFTLKSLKIIQFIEIGSVIFRTQKTIL